MRLVLISLTVLTSLLPLPLQYWREEILFTKQDQAWVYILPYSLGAPLGKIRIGLGKIRIFKYIVDEVGGKVLSTIRER